MLASVRNTPPPPPPTLDFVLLFHNTPLRSFRRKQVRAHASVLKRALLDEQQKAASLVESLRQRDTSLRRLEQEIDSLGFRNKQLEHRVTTLQDDLRRTDGKANSSSNAVLAGLGTTSTQKTHAGRQQRETEQQKQLSSITPTTSQMFVDELETRINENALLATQLADQIAEQQRLVERCTMLEQREKRQREEHATLEHRLRNDLATLCQRVIVLEASDPAACSSDDTFSVISDHGGSSTPINHHLQHKPTSSFGLGSAATATITCDTEKCARLERELFQLRTQLEFISVRDTPVDVLQEKSRALRRASNGPNGAPWTVSKREATSAATTEASADADSTEQSDHHSLATKATVEEQTVREKWVLRHFSEKFDALFAQKQEAESQTKSCVLEVSVFSTGQFTTSF